MHASSYNEENGWVKEQNVLHSFLREYAEFKVHMTLVSALEFGKKFITKTRISQTINVSRNLTHFLLLKAICVAQRSMSKDWIVNPLYGIQTINIFQENRHIRRCYSRVSRRGWGHDGMTG